MLRPPTCAGDGRKPRNEQDMEVGVFPEGAPNQPHDLDCNRFLPRWYPLEKAYCLLCDAATPRSPKDSRLQRSRHARFQSAFRSESLMGAAMRKCDGHGTCSRSQRSHQLLRGIQPSSGRFFTIVAEPYPRKLCRRLVEAYMAAIAHFNAEHIYKDLFSGMSDGLGNRINKLYDPRDKSGPCQFGPRVCFRVKQCV